MLRWALMMQGYKYELNYRPGSQNQSADCLSRLPLQEWPTDVPMPGEAVNLLNTLERSPTTAKDITEWTQNVPTLSHITRYGTHGWPKKVNPELTPYNKVRDELSLEGGCILRGSWVVVPTPGYENVSHWHSVNLSIFLSFSRLERETVAP